MLLALCMLSGSWMPVPRMPSPGRGAVVAGELEMFEVVRPEEGGPDGVIAFRLLNGAVAPSDISITYVVNATVSAPADNGVDYAALPGTITLSAGAAEVQLPIVVTDDLLIEGDENLELTLLSAVDQVGDNYLNPNRTLTTRVIDNDNRISITKVTDGAELGNGNASNGSFLISLPGTLTFNEDIPVRYTIDGISSATGGPGATYDYDNVMLTGEIVLPANTNSIVLPIAVNDDLLVEHDETVQITVQDNNLSAVTGMKFTFDPAQATAVMIIDDDDARVPVNILSTVDGAEPGGAAGNGSFTIGWPNGLSATGSIIVRLSIAGTATANADYTTIPVTRLLPAGASSVTIPVTVLNDLLVEGAETVVLTITGLTPGAGVPPLIIGPNNTATVTIADDDIMSSLQWKSASYTGTGAGGAVTAGDLITYAVHVRNAGNVSLANVQIADTIPAYTELVSADENIVPDADGKLTWTIPAIAAGAADVVRSFTVRVVNDLTGVTNITNTAFVDNGDGTGGHPTSPPGPGDPGNPHPGPDPDDPSTDIPADDGGKQSANWKSAAYTGTGANGTVRPGDEIVYTVHVRNTGHVRLDNVLITDNLPAYTEFLSADDGIVPDATGRLIWTIPLVPVGAADVTRSFTVRVINDLTGAAGILNTAGIDNGNGSGEQPSTPPDPGNPNEPHPGPVNPGDPSTHVPVDTFKRSAAWKSAAYAGSGASGAVRPGDEITYTIHIRNTGYVSLHDVRIMDSIPAYTEFISAEEGIIPDAAGRLTWTIPGIPVGGPDITRSFTVRVVNDLTHAIHIINTGWVDNGDGSGDHPTSPPDPADPGDPHPNPDPDDPATEIPVDNGKSSANWKSASYTGTGEGGSVTTGDEITYTMHVRNTGSVTLTHVLVTDNVPDYTEFVSAEEGIAPDGAGRLAWTIPAIPVGGADVTRSYTVRVARDLTGATSIVNTAAVDNGNGNGSRPTTPPDPGNPNEPHPHPDPNDPSTDIPVDTVIRFDTWKTVITQSGDPKAKPGEVLTYTIHLRNTGNVAIPSIQVTDPVPDHTTFISAADGGAFNQAANTVNWTVSDLAVESVATVSFQVRVEQELDSVPVIINTATVTDGNVTVPTSGCDPAQPGCNGLPGTSIETAPAEEGLFFVNAMSPNGDGRNEYFVIRGLERYPGASLYVFNRWGSMVYQAKDYRNDWNGAGLSEGTYYYRLEIKQGSGTKLYKGWVVIKRN
ncbi:putative repeat protein (TIGR01451 family)/gliding motility-associated-like protein [Chitinophaga japonensis]|uniref:Putative repeat protein (TIGR01451 family)/gliding motility-associated-like protein n=2 Tax=Chitinophaga japonensis TaxID=104662 RepID=A0A562SSG3_CHIJA|nr:putative repeat protein (TIGR01451 family)/gliding motility-associated-like protein [Chitinophaga japonensis]